MNSASLAMNRRISHGQAMRSIFGRSRVTHLLGMLASSCDVRGYDIYELRRYNCLMITKSRAAEPTNWMLLLHQLPARPAYARVKLWRHLQSLGAVAVKNAVYALPAGPQAQEDFE